MPNQKFQTPQDSDTYVSFIKKRCENLITHQIWSGIDKNILNQWFKNFTTPEEKYFAACILDNLIFRSKEQTEAMIFQLLSRSIPDIFRKIPPPIQVLDFISSLKKSTDPKIRFVPIINDEDMTQSGFAVSRMLKTMNFCNKDWIIAPSKISKVLKEGVKVIIFIDDFLGTGHQFDKVGGNLKIDSLSKSHYILYAPLAAHEDGIKRINTSFPNVKVTTSELITKTASVFSSCFDDSQNTPEVAKKFYELFLKKKGIKSNSSVDRFNLYIAYAFEHGVPNNSIKILYHKRNWNQLFNR
jgi:hypothetical protein